MNRVFMIHGFEGTPNGGWRPWLMGELAKHGIFASSLSMPKPATPSKNEWVDTISHAVGGSLDGVYLIGHSLGVPAILHYLDQLPEGKKIEGVILVSGPYINTKVSYSVLLESFFPLPDLEKTRSKAKKVVVVHGEKDEVVPYSQAEFLSKELQADLYKIENKGHLGDGDGTFELPEVLFSLKKMMGLTDKV